MEPEEERAKLEQLGALVVELTRPEIPEVVLTADQVAAGLSISLDYVYTLCREGRIPSFRVGKFVRVRARDYNAFLAKGAV